MDDGQAPMHAEEASSYASLTSFYRAGTFSSSASRVPTGGADVHSVSSKIPSKYHDFIELLAICQQHQIDFLGITWDRLLDDNSNLVGLGMTSAITPGLLKLDLSFAFKRLTDRYFGRNDDESSERRRHHLYEALISEISVLGHPVIREHANIIRLEGVCWDFLPDDQEEKVRPVLVFEKASHGDLVQFLRSPDGLALNLQTRLRLCSDIVRAIATMHSAGESQQRRFVYEGSVYKRLVEADCSRNHPRRSQTPQYLDI